MTGVFFVSSAGVVRLQFFQSGLGGEVAGIETQHLPVLRGGFGNPSQLDEQGRHVATGDDCARHDDRARQDQW